MKWRTISPWSHVTAMVYGQLAHAFGLNDICDALAHYVNPLKTIRGATPPSRNGLSNANMKRNGKIAEELFWEVFKYLRTQFKEFGGNQKAVKRILGKLKMRLDFHSFLTRFAVVDTAKHSDPAKAY